MAALRLPPSLNRVARNGSNPGSLAISTTISGGVEDVYSGGLDQFAEITGGLQYVAKGGGNQKTAL